MEKELKPFLAGDVLTAQQSSSFDPNRDLSYGYSSKSKFLVLTDCLNGMQLIKIGNANPNDVFSFSEKCVSLANDIINSMPTNSHAWLVKAWASGELFDIDGLNIGLRQSHATAPNELWLAKVRLELAERKRPLINRDTKKSIDEDIAMMAGNYKGSRDLAARYQNDKAFRERVVSIIETLPNELQKQFLYNVKRAGEPG